MPVVMCHDVAALGHRKLFPRRLSSRGMKLTLFWRLLGEKSHSKDNDNLLTTGKTEDHAAKPLNTANKHLCLICWTARDSSTSYDESFQWWDELRHRTSKAAGVA
jgi:hypothetical protein